MGSGGTAPGSFKPLLRVLGLVNLVQGQSWVPEGLRLGHLDQYLGRRCMHIVGWARWELLGIDGLVPFTLGSQVWREQVKLSVTQLGISQPLAV